MSELTVLKDGKIVNTTLVIPAKFSAEFSDQKLLDIKRNYHSYSVRRNPS